MNVTLLVVYWGQGHSPVSLILLLAPLPYVTKISPSVIATEAVYFPVGAAATPIPHQEFLNE